MSGCVKAQGPVVQGSVVQSPVAEGPVAKGATQSAGGPASTNQHRGSSSPVQQTGEATTPQENTGVTRNAGVEAQPGAAVGDAIRKGPLQANGTVTHIVDGDTLDVVFLTNGETSGANNGANNGAKAKGPTERIRLIGIDTPETKRPDTPVECFGREASSALAALIPVGTPIMVERDVEERDRYGRLLGYVFRASDGLFVNHEMVRAGMATPYTFPPNIAYVDVFTAAGDASRSAAAGLWSRCESAHTPAT
jgi:micrococcal nuclease